MIFSTRPGKAFSYSAKIGGGGRGREPLTIIKLISIAFVSFGSSGFRPAVRSAVSSSGGMISIVCSDCGGLLSAVGLAGVGAFGFCVLVIGSMLQQFVN